MTMRSGGLPLLTFVVYTAEVNLLLLVIKGFKIMNVPSMQQVRLMENMGKCMHK